LPDVGEHDPRVTEIRVVVDQRDRLVADVDLEVRALLAGVPGERGTGDARVLLDQQQRRARPRLGAMAVGPVEAGA